MNGLGGLELKDWLSAAALLVSVSIAVSGWLINAWLTRRHHIFQKRLDRRLEMQNGILRLIEAVVVISAKDPDSQEYAKKYLELSRSASLSVQLFGYPDEQSAFFEFTKALDRKNLEEVNATLNVLAQLVGDRVKQDLGFSTKQRETFDPKIV